MCVISIHIIKIMEVKYWYITRDDTREVYQLRHTFGKWYTHIVSGYCHLANSEYLHRYYQVTWIIQVSYTQ